jgi:carboxylate-amine ligase
MGVEEEFLLADPRSGVAVECADRVLARVQVCQPLPENASLHRELWDSQLQTVTGGCVTAAELRGHLVACRRTLAEAAAAEDAAIIGTGTPLLASHTHRRIPTEGRFARIYERYSELVGDDEACGCHVNVAVADHDTAVAVVNHLARWLPTLLAISVNSPFDRGRDTGYGSWRAIQRCRFPGSGISPPFASHTEYREVVAKLVECGTLVDEEMTFWLARPSSGDPAVELRVADTAATVDEAVLYALLARALVRAALDELDRGREAAPVSPQTGAAAMWSAARHGLAGSGVEPADARRVPATHLVSTLLAHTREALEDSKDWQIVTGAVADLRKRGTGADRQRHAAEDGLPAVLRMLTEQAVPHA